MIGNILGIIGVLLTIAFGIYSIWVYKKSKLKVSLEFKNKECYSLFRDEVTRLNIEVKYNGNPLTSTLILLKAKLINNGHLDIDKNRIYNPLKIKSTSEFKWLESRITHSPTGSTNNININNPHELQLDWDLLKIEEWIEIEALVEVQNVSKMDSNKTNDFFNGISFDFRITDLYSIHKEKQVAKSDKRSILSKYPKVFASAIALFGLIMSICQYVPSFNFLPSKHNIEYKLNDGTNQSKAIISSKKSDNLILKISDKEDNTELTVNDFNKKYKIEKIDNTCPDPMDSIINKVIGIVYLVMGLSLLVLLYVLEYRKKKRKKLTQEKASH